MSKLSLVSVALAVATSGTAFAQTPPAVPVPTPSVAAPAQETLIGGQSAAQFTGWYIAPTSGVTSFDGSLSYVPGVRAALMLNHQFGVGAAVNLLGTDRTRVGDSGAREVGAYGGLYLQYDLAASRLVHAYADTTIGSGGWCAQSVNDDCNVRHFAVIEPTLNVELNLARHVKLATGVGYRVAIAEKGPGLSSRDLSGIVARTSLILGMF